LLARGCASSGMRYRGSGVLLCVERDQEFGGGDVQDLSIIEVGRDSMDHVLGSGPVEGLHCCLVSRSLGLFVEEEIGVSGKGLGHGGEVGVDAMR